LGLREDAVEEDLAGAAALGVFGTTAGEGLGSCGTPFPLAEAEALAADFLLREIHRAQEICITQDESLSKIK